MTQRFERVDLRRAQLARSDVQHTHAPDLDALRRLHRSACVEAVITAVERDTSHSVGRVAAGIRNLIHALGLHGDLAGQGVARQAVKLEAIPAEDPDVFPVNHADQSQRRITNLGRKTRDVIQRRIAGDLAEIVLLQRANAWELELLYTLIHRWLQNRKATPSVAVPLSLQRV